MKNIIEYILLLLIIFNFSEIVLSEEIATSLSVEKTTNDYKAAETILKESESTDKKNKNSQATEPKFSNVLLDEQKTIMRNFHRKELTVNEKENYYKIAQNNISRKEISSFEKYVWELIAGACKDKHFDVSSKCEKALNAKMSIEDKSSIRLFMARMDSYLNERRMLDTYREAIKLDAKNYEWIKENRYFPEIEKKYLFCLTLNPQDAQILEKLGDYYESLAIRPSIENPFYSKKDRDKLAKALINYGQALKINPKIETVHKKIIDIHEKNKDIDNTVSTATRALNVNPSNTYFLNALGDVYYIRGGSHVNDSVNYYERSLAIDENQVKVWKLLGLIYETRKNKSKSVKCYVKCLELGGTIGNAEFVDGNLITDDIIIKDSSDYRKSALDEYRKMQMGKK